jgi:hypothetical protein
VGREIAASGDTPPGGSTTAAAAGFPPETKPPRAPVPPGGIAPPGVAGVLGGTPAGKPYPTKYRYAARMMRQTPTDAARSRQSQLPRDSARCSCVVVPYVSPVSFA